MAEYTDQKFCIALLCIIFSAVSLLLLSTLISDDQIIGKTIFAANTSIPQFKSTINIHSIQNTLLKLPLHISSHDYSTWNEDIIVNNHTFKHFSTTLLSNVLSNKTILFFGDSTVYRFYVFIVYCLDQYIQNKISNACIFNSQLLNHNYTEWDFALMHADQLFKLVHNIKSLGEKGYQYDAPIFNITLILFENKDERSITHLFALYHSFIEYKPNIIFWNPSGLHLLHLYNLRKFGNHSIEIINRFTDNLMEIYDIASQLNACLIYRALSPLCYTKDTFVYQDARSVYLQHTDNELDKAAYIHFMSNCIKEYKDNTENSEELCKNWTFSNEGGISYQNKIMEQFVIDVQNETFGEFNHVFFYDRYHIFHSDPNICIKEAKDAVHWCISYGADAYYFANFVDLACN
eukprot:197051_1